uniref:Ribosome biogenesis protein NOP53 n=1 Tax=Globodera pallida TaxID=36090 RepID=A0A183C5L2_GLOPA
MSWRNVTFLLRRQNSINHFWALYMARHRRYPLKKSAQYKDSTKKDENLPVEIELAPLPAPMDGRSRKMNKTPPASMVDDQPVTWKARFGKAGRDVKEIAEEYKMMDEKAKQRKLLKLARKEKQLNLLQKDKTFREKSHRNGPIIEEDGTKILEGDGIEREEEKTEEGEEQRRGGAWRNRTKPTTEKERMQLAKADKTHNGQRKEQKRPAKELILNAREVIPFGARVDAPPTFNSDLFRKIRPLHAGAGKKELLLKQLLRFDNNRNVSK